jgi:transcriptional regulator with XRE-family HTH domain
MKADQIKDRAILPDEPTLTTGDWIKRYRRAARLTQIELARATHKTQATISRWEAGQEAIFINDLETLAALFRAKGLNPEPPPGLTPAIAPAVPVRGYITAGGAVQTDPDRVERVPAPEGYGHLCLVAYRVATDTLPVLAREAILFTEQREPGEPMDDAVNVLSIISTPERGMLLGLPRAAARGRYIIERPTGRTVETTITTAAPVLLVQFGA